MNFFYHYNNLLFNNKEYFNNVWQFNLACPKFIFIGLTKSAQQKWTAKQGSGRAAHRLDLI